MHLAQGPGPWERARLAGELQDIQGLQVLNIDHTPFGKTILRQLAEFAEQMHPVKFKVNLRMKRPGQSG